MTIVLFEKGDDWPVHIFKKKICKILYLFSNKAADVFDCPVCLSFWTTAFCDIVLFIFSHGMYFLWPLSGFAAIGIVWFVYENLMIKDKMVNKTNNKDTNDEKKGQNG